MMTLSLPPSSRVSIVWLRRDLRLHDNAAIAAACDPSQYKGMIPVFCLDPERDVEPRRAVEQGGLGVPRLGPHRARCVHGAQR